MDNNQENKSTITNILGLNLDANPADLKEGEVTFALNACIFSSGNSYYYRNYEGNETCFTLPTGYLLVSSKAISKDKFVLFLVNMNDTSSGQNNSEIGILDGCSYTRIVRAYCLNFNISYQIQSEYKDDYNCGRVIYFTDNLNPRRYLNLDKVPLTITGYKDDNCTPIYGELDCDAILINPIYDYPCIALNSINNTGVLISGAYQLGIQYSDSNGIAFTDVSNLTNQIDIIRATSSFIIAGDAPNTPTFKSIVLDFTNLDVSFSYFNLIVLKTLNRIKTAQKVITLPINTAQYTYTGLEPSTIDISPDEVLARTTIYDKAKTIAQSQGYLFWGNLTEKKIDNFQPYANNIRVQWMNYRVDYDDTNHTYKDETSINIRMSLMRDEIYPIGIRLLYNTGDTSCVYHIPGRKKNYKSDGVKINYWDNFNPSTIHKDQYNTTVDTDLWDSSTIASAGDDNYSSSTERWEVYNTATFEGYTTEAITWYSGHGSSFDEYEGCFKYGEMAYWESELTYPSDVSIWNNGAVDLACEPIRHHKMPDCSISHIHENSDPYIYPLGLKISNIIISNTLFPDVVGYEIVIGDRTYQKSILDKGLLFNNKEHTQAFSSSDFLTPSPYIYTCYTYNDIRALGGAFYNDGHEDLIKSKYYTLYSPEALFRRTNVGIASEVKVESEENGIYTTIGTPTLDCTSGTNINNNFAFANINPLYISRGFYDTFLLPKYASIRRSIDNILYVNNDVYQAGTLGNINNLGRESSLMFNTSSSLSAIANPTTADNSADIINPIEASDEISSYYVALKGSSLNLWGTIDSINYLNSGKCFYNPSETSQSCVFIGDTFISRFSIHKRIMFHNGMDYLFNQDKSAEADFVDWDMFYAVPIFFVESSINTEYRYNGSLIQEYFYPNLNFNAVSIQDWLCLKNTWWNIDNFYLYNFDYSTINNSNSICTPLASFNPNDCDPHYFSRIIYSLKNNEEGLADNWLLYPTLNVFDFNKSKGELWDIKSLGSNKILYRFEDGMYVNVTNQQVTTNESNFTLKAAELFDPEPIELFTADTGYIGTRSQWAFNNTAFGSFMIDDKRNKIFRFKESFEPISSIKMNSWFNDNLRLKLLDTYPDFRDLDNPSNPNSIGFTSTYDSVNDLLIITKHDFIPVDSEAYPAPVYNSCTNKFYIPFVTSDSTTCELVSWDMTDMPVFSGEGSGSTVAISYNQGADFAVCTAELPNLTANTPQELLNHCFNIGFIANQTFCVDKNSICILEDPILDYEEMTFYDIDSGLPYFSTPVQCWSEVSILNTNYFNKQSYTISFSTKNSTWISWYSFLPNGYIQTNNGYNSFTNNTTGVIRSHLSSSSFNHYDGADFKYILEYPIKLNNNNLNSLFWRTYAYKLNTDYEYKDITFNSGYIYTSDQNTGNLVLVPKNPNLPSQSITYPISSTSYTSILTSRDNNIWSIGYIWDKISNRSSGNSMFSSSLSNTDYSSAYYIDKVIDNTEINYTKNWYDLKPLKNLWAKVRLIFDNTQVKLVSNIFISNSSKSFRN